MDLLRLKQLRQRNVISHSSDIDIVFDDVIYSNLI